MLVELKHKKQDTLIPHYFGF